MTVTDFSALQRLVADRVLAPESEGFAEAHQGFNLAVQHQPDLVVRATSLADVVAAVKFAADLGLPVRVQSTGHGIGAPMAGGVLINTAGMQQLAINPQRRYASVAAGVRWADVIDAASTHGLATLCGSSPTVGVVGYTLGGGMGPMGRTFGFASDRVRRLQFVDAAGQVVLVDPHREPELFWAMRGGKPDVGIVTKLEFDLVDVATYYGGAIFYPGQAAASVIHEFAQWAPTLPDSVTTSIALLRLPDLPFVPEPLRGTVSVQLRFVHIGDPADGELLLAPMRAVAAPLFDLVEVTPAGAIASVHQDPTEPMPARDEAMLLREFPAAAADALLAAAGPDVDIPLIVTEVRLMGGALARDGGLESAVCGRDGAFNLCVIGPYPPPLVDAVDAASAAVLNALRPWRADGGLINFQGNATGAEQVRAVWTAPVRERLDALKRQWDPDGVFRFGYSVG